MQISQSDAETNVTRPRFDQSKENHWVDTLSDGTHVLVRPVRAEDRQLEKNFIRGLSPESMSFSFLGDLSPRSAVLPNQSADRDAPLKIVFIALIPDNDHLREIGISRFATARDGRQCECAIAVADDWQHRGLGITLMKHLISVARENNFTQLYAIESAANLPMRTLAKDLGFTHNVVADDATMVRYELEL